jgi:hypothetical protein
MTSGPFYCWYFLLLKLQIFLCYLGFQVMAILCCVAKNSLRGTALYLHKCEQYLTIISVGAGNEPVWPSDFGVLKPYFGYYQW